MLLGVGDAGIPGLPPGAGAPTPPSPLLGSSPKAAKMAALCASNSSPVTRPAARSLSRLDTLPCAKALASRRRAMSAAASVLCASMFAAAITLATPASKPPSLPSSPYSSA
eukprot:356232-Chlamydomonas_euryale.AAC.3